VKIDRKIVPLTARKVCAVCNRGGKFEYATYVGAPIGGVPVHAECLKAFFKQLDSGTRK
jgi:hypothetical protein